MAKRLISLTIISVALLMGCDAATQYDTGAVVLDVSDDQAFNNRLETTESFLSAYDALKAEDYPRAEALLDQALAQRPRDPYALLAMGTVMERTGRFYKATDFYLSSARYGENALAGQALVDGEETPATSTRTVAEVANENLARLQK